MVFPVVMSGCKSWTIKKVDHRRIDAFELWCWRRLLRVPWTARRSNQSILKKSVLNIHWKDWSWSSNALATWCKKLTHWKRPWCWERLTVGGGDDRGWDGWMASLTRWTWVWISSGSWWWTGKPGVLQSVESQRVGHDWVTELNWSFRGGSDGKESYTMQETWVRSLGWEEPLEEDMATHSRILAWRSPVDGGALWATVHGVTKSWTWLSD